MRHDVYEIDLQEDYSSGQTEKDVIMSLLKYKSWNDPLLLSYYLNLESITDQLKPIFSVIFALSDNKSLFYSVEPTLKYEYVKYYPAHSSILLQDLDLIDYFMENNVDSKDDNGMTPLSVAVSNGYIKTAMYILNKFKPTIDDIDMFGNTMLHYAVNSQNITLVMSFDNVLQENKKGETPLDVSVKNNLIEITDYLLRSHKNEKDESLIYYAITNRNLEMINLLKKHGVKTRKSDIQHELDMYANDGDAENHVKIMNVL